MNLNGMKNLDSAGGLQIVNNPNQESISHLASLSTTSFSELFNAGSLISAGYLTIEENDLLETLDLGSLTTVSDLVI